MLRQIQISARDSSSVLKLLLLLRSWRNESVMPQCWLLLDLIPHLCCTQMRVHLQWVIAYSPGTLGGWFRIWTSYSLSWSPACRTRWTDRGRSCSSQPRCCRIPRRPLSNISIKFVLLHTLRVCIPGPVFSFPGIGNLPKAIPGRPGIPGMT